MNLGSLRRGVGSGQTCEVLRKVRAVMGAACEGGAVLSRVA